MIELKTTNEIMPRVDFNFEDVKAALELSLKSYENIVVTEQTLSACKATQRDLAGLRGRIETFRKDKKAEMTKPITAFEAKCKDLIALVDAVEKPIKAGISVYDDVRREEKRKTAERLIAEAAEAYGLRPEYAEKLDVDEKYMNLTAKESAVKDDLWLRAETLKTEQQARDDMVAVIEGAIKAENERLVAKLDIADFMPLLQSGWLPIEIIEQIRERAGRVREAENAYLEKPEKPAEIGEETPETTVGDGKPEREPLYWFEFHIEGTKDQIKGLYRFLDSQGMAIAVTGKGMI